MKVLYALICEHADTRADGRVDAHGIFHQLYAPGFPAMQDRLTLALGLEWDVEEAGRQFFRVDLLDPMQSPILTINGHTDVSTRSPGQAPPQTRLLMPLEQVVFAAGGSYEFELHLEDQRYPLAPLHLIENPGE